MIVILTNIPTPYRTAFFDEVARQCVERGIGFKVFYCAQTEPNRHWPFEPEKMKHPFEVLPGWHPVVGGAYPHLNFSVISRLRALRPDVLICGGAWNTPTIQLAVSKWLWGGKKIVFWTEGHADAAIKSSGVIPMLRHWTYRRFDAFAVPNKRSGDWARLNAGWNAPLIPLPNTIDEEYYRRIGPDERSRARNSLRIPEECRLLIQVSQLEPRKGVVELAAAFARASTGTNAKLAIVGSGSLDERIRQGFARELSEGRIILTGHVDKAVVRQWLMAADAFVLNTYRDPNPLTPIEASFAQLPVLASKAAGNFAELVFEGRTGFAIEDPTDPTPAIKCALEIEKGLLESMGSAANENATLHFTQRNAAYNFIVQVAALAGCGKLASPGTVQ